jgi:protein-tyrosine-phosphatase
MAHAIFLSEVEKRKLPVDVYSAGVLDFRGAPAIADTTRTCSLHNTPPPKDVANWVRDLPLDSITRFLVMEQYHADALIGNFGVAPERVSLLGEFDPQQRGLEIDDPYSYSSDVYAECYGQIRDCIVNYLATTDELSR